MKIDAKMAGALSALIGVGRPCGPLDAFFWKVAKKHKRDQWQDEFCNLIDALGHPGKVSLQDAVNHIAEEYDNVQLP